MRQSTSLKRSLITQTAVKVPVRPAKQVQVVNLQAHTHTHTSMRLKSLILALAIALQVLVNGLTQPLWGQMADRIGGRSVIMIGASLQVVALIGMALSDSLFWFTVFAGLVMGCAVSAAAGLRRPCCTRWTSWAFSAISPMTRTAR